jgi:hypothetical protein
VDGWGDHHAGRGGTVAAAVARGAWSGGATRSPSLPHFLRLSLILSLTLSHSLSLSLACSKPVLAAGEFAFQQVVRKKAEREALPGHACDCCRAFYLAACGLDPSAPIPVRGSPLVMNLQSSILMAQTTDPSSWRSTS